MYIDIHMCIHIYIYIRTNINKQKKQNTITECIMYNE